MPENGEPQNIPIAPIQIALNGCQFNVEHRPDGGIILTFTHATGVLQAIAQLPEAGKHELARQLHGITIHRNMAGL